nr:MAG TPA: hypothetical protein [Caudoviricetes sp.]
MLVQPGDTHDTESRWPLMLPPPLRRTPARSPWLL